MPVPIPPDTPWDLGEDNLARNTRKALEAAGITPAHADRMTTHQLSLVRGLGIARVERVEACLERMRNAPARADGPDADAVAAHVQAFLDARPYLEPGEPSSGILAVPDPDPTRGRWLQLTDNHLRVLLADRALLGTKVRQLAQANAGLREAAARARELADVRGDSIHTLLSHGTYEGPPIPQEVAGALNGPRTVMLPTAVPAEAGQAAGQGDDDGTPGSAADASRREPPGICGFTIGRHGERLFVCTLEPHYGYAHATAGAIARLMDGGNWTIESGRQGPDAPPRDFMWEARQANRPFEDLEADLRGRAKARTAASAREERDHHRAVDDRPRPVDAEGGPA